MALDLKRKVFVYGFGRYGKHTTNITEQIIDQLKPHQNNEN